MAVCTTSNNNNYKYIVCTLYYDCYVLAVPATFISDWQEVCKIALSQLLVLSEWSTVSLNV